MVRLICVKWLDSAFNMSQKLTLRYIKCWGNMALYILPVLRNLLLWCETRQRGLQLGSRPAMSVQSGMLQFIFSLSYENPAGGGGGSLFVLISKFFIRVSIVQNCNIYERMTEIGVTCC